MMEKPEVVVDFFGEGSNIFFIELQAMLSLAERKGKNLARVYFIPQDVKENAKDYYDAIRIIGKYVELIPAENDLQNEYYAKRPDKIVDGSFVAGLVKTAIERRKNDK